MILVSVCNKKFCVHASPSARRQFRGDGSVPVAAMRPPHRNRAKQGARASASRLLPCALHPLPRLNRIFKVSEKSCENFQFFKISAKSCKNFQFFQVSFHV